METAQKLDDYTINYILNDLRELQLNSTETLNMDQNNIIDYIKLHILGLSSEENKQEVVYKPL